jgi:hypothetical protein
LISEAAYLLADAFDHTLDKPETLVKLYAILAGSGSFPPTRFSSRQKRFPIALLSWPQNPAGKQMSSKR